MKRFIVTFMASLLIAAPVVAQEVTEIPTVAPVVEVTEEAPVTNPGDIGLDPSDEVVAPEGALERLLTTITQFVYVNAGTAALVLTLVAAVKLIVPSITPTQAGLANIGVSFALWVLYWLASNAGQIELYNSLVQGIDVILVGLLSVVTTSLGAAKFHDLAETYRIPVLGINPAKKATVR